MYVTGVVVKGLGVAGPMLGTPTANVALEALPPIEPGVYAVIATLGEERRGAVVCYGADPEHKKFEVHILDWTGNLEGSTLTVEVVERIRPLVAWESAEQMRALIAQDIAQAKNILASRI